MSAGKAEQECATVDVLIGGFGGSAAGYAELLDEMRQATGNRTVFIGMNRWGLMRFRHNRRYPRALYRQALHVLLELKRHNAHRVRLYGHSMGGAIALMVADAFGPTLQIEYVVALNPAGVYVDGTMPLALRMMRKAMLDAHMLKNHADERVRRIILASKKGGIAYLSNPIRSLAEGLALSRTRILATAYPVLRTRRVPIAIVYSDEDIVFVSAAMLQALNDLPGVSACELKTTPHDIQYFPAETVWALQHHGVL